MDLSRRELFHDDVMGPIRANMLEALDGWYHKELHGVDNALARAWDSHFGICLGCNSEIDQNRLEKCPEAEFCLVCEGMKKWMEIG
jgi:RNA polymerase-binding transcription factor DksA